MKTRLFFILIILLTHITIRSQIANNLLTNPKAFTTFLNEKNVWGKKYLLGYSKNNLPIYAYYYNKGGSEKAMIIGGVHGSEFYGVDVANATKKALDKMKVSSFKYKVIIIPELFPDNVAKGRLNIFTENFGRKTCEVCNGLDMEPECKLCVDPNRQMPCVNEYYEIGKNLTCTSETIEIENQILLYMTQKYDPSRIVSLHCKNDFRKNEIGIYADPRTGKDNVSLGYSDDALLALKMAFIVKENRGVILGNFISEKYTKAKDSFKIKSVSYLNPVYPQDPPAENKGTRQIRSYENNDNKVSFGTWASSEIWDQNNKKLKKAAITVTVELPQYYSFFSEKYNEGSLRQEELNDNTNAYVKAIVEGFLDHK
ncbi:hypothetical protein MQX03_01640 [Chryseobacterium aahli]|uniref:hypothetical protein n=1 Tax=Chryseobacterium aahli TaxID=1278643 RepID=UPI001F61C5B0|nr:hypothetical protein [Chryseobacterium aahli]MCI3935881.1 hypothetical protein [Chryseobacterium aahli]